MGGNSKRCGRMVWGKEAQDKLLAVVSGFCQEVLPKGMKFGHAGAKEVEARSARGKADAQRMPVQSSADMAPLALLKKDI